MTLRLAASTLGAPGVDLPTVLELIAAAGGTGVELRAAAGEPVHSGLDAAGRSTVRQQLADAGITPLAVSSYVMVAREGVDAEVITNLRQHLELAADLGARFLRVFPGAASPGPEADRRAAQRLSMVCGIASELGVRPVLETHDSHPRGADVARVLDLLDGLVPGHPVGAIWDLLHPWRSGEDPAHTWDALRDRISADRGFVQVKDARSYADTTPVLPGTGKLPLQAVLKMLQNNGYEGWYSLEWERAWYPDIPELGPALRAAAELIPR